MRVTAEKLTAWPYFNPDKMTKSKNGSSCLVSTSDELLPRSLVNPGSAVVAQEQ